jgi:hypothetical protein
MTMTIEGISIIRQENLPDATGQNKTGATLLGCAG